MSLPIILSPPFSREYVDKVRNIDAAHLVAYWPLSEGSGTVAKDWGPYGRNGAYTAVTLGGRGIGDGKSSASFDGSTSYCNVYSAALVAAFNGAEGTLAGWAKVSAAGVWTDGAARLMACFRVDSNNRIQLQRSTVNGALSFLYAAGGVSLQRDVTSLSLTTWMAICLTWSKSGDAAIAYLNGAQQGATLTGLGTWAGNLASTLTCVGAASTVPAYVWSGPEAHWALWNAALTPTQVARLAKP
jgi:hypothetical protein